MEYICGKYTYGICIYVKCICEHIYVKCIYIYIHIIYNSIYPRTPLQSYKWILFYSPHSIDLKFESH